MFKSLSQLFRPRVEALGLEIGASALKLVEVSGNPPALKALASRPTPPGLLMEGMVAEPAALAQEIKELLLEARTRKRYVVTALSNLAVILRPIQVPKMPLKEMEEAVRWEAERYIPFPIDEVVLDFAPLTPLSEVQEGEQVQVMVAAAPSTRPRAAASSGCTCRVQRGAPFTSTFTLCIHELLLRR